MSQNMFKQNENINLITVLLLTRTALTKHPYGNAGCFINRTKHVNSIKPKGLNLFIYAVL